jgi:hypothetical protein
VHDTGAINTALGNYSSKIAEAAIGKSEIADGQARRQLSRGEAMSSPVRRRQAFP